MLFWCRVETLKLHSNGSNRQTLFIQQGWTDVGIENLANQTCQRSTIIILQDVRTDQTCCIQQWWMMLDQHMDPFDWPLSSNKVFQRIHMLHPTTVGWRWTNMLVPFYWPLQQGVPTDPHVASNNVGWRRTNMLDPFDWPSFNKVFQRIHILHPTTVGWRWANMLVQTRCSNGSTCCIQQCWTTLDQHVGSVWSTIIIQQGVPTDSHVASSNVGWRCTNMLDEHFDQALSPCLSSLTSYLEAFGSLNFKAF